MQTLATGEGAGAQQAHAADIYSAITASAEAVQSATGCKNSLSKEQESQQKGGRKDREGRREGW